MRWDSGGVRGTGVMIHQSPRTGRERSRQGEVAYLSKQADPWAGVSIIRELSSTVGLKRPGMWAKTGSVEPGLALSGRG